MKNKYYICLILLVNFSGLIFADSAHVYLTEGGNVGGISLLNSNYVDKSSSYILGDFIKRTNTLLTNVNVNITLVERDCRPVRDPDTKIWNNSSLLEIAKSGEFSGIIDRYKESPINFIPIEISLHTLSSQTDLIWSKTIPTSSNMVKVSYNFKDEFYPYEVIKNVQKTTNVISYVVGAPELVYPEGFERKAYKVPELFKIQFSKLSSQLKKTGTSIAYDPKTKILVVVDKVNSVTFLFLKTLGFKSI
jgi:hypothetical protein